MKKSFFLFVFLSFAVSLPGQRIDNPKQTETKEVIIENYLKYRKAESSGKAAGLFFVGLSAVLTGYLVHPNTKKVNSSSYTVAIAVGTIGIMSYIGGQSAQNKADKELVKLIKL